MYCYMSRSVHTIFLRLKYLCSRYGKLAAIGLVVLSSLALAGSAVAYTAPPETTQVTQQTDVQTFMTTVNTSAAVTGDTTLYDTDQQLANMPVYLLAATPEMTLRAQTAVPDDRAVEVTQQVTMELYATRDDEVFWTETETLATDSQQVTDGSLVTETTVNISDIRRGRLREVQPEVNNVGTVGATFHVDTVYNTDKYQGHLSVKTPVEITDRAYSLETPQSAEKSHATPVTRTLTRPDDTITFGSPAAANATTQAGLGAIISNGPTTVPKESAIQGGIGLLGLFIALVVWRIYRRNPEWESLKHSYDKARYSEWISFGTVQMGDTYERVTISGLTDLLDIAIDSNKRIIHDRDQSLYAVLDGTVAYEYNEADDECDLPEHSDTDVSSDGETQGGSRAQESSFEVSTNDKTGDSLWGSPGESVDTHDETEAEQTAPDTTTADEPLSPQTNSQADDAGFDELVDSADEDPWELFEESIQDPTEQAVLDPTENDTKAEPPADD